MFRVIDTLHLGRPHVIQVGLVGEGESLALIDSGPDTVFAHTVAELRRLGLRPENVSRVFVTHIHLDHSGGAWRWAEEFGATIGVHPLGAPHLADPARLLASAGQIFGHRMDSLWGEVRGVPADRLRIVRDGEEVRAGATNLRVVETPGHASHHHAYWLEAARTLFAGDVAGVSILGGPCLPPCPPPDIQVESWQASLARIRALQPARLVLTHGGVLENPAERLVELERRLLDWAGWIRERLRAGHGEERITADFTQRVWGELRAAGLGEEDVAGYEQGDPAATSVYGLVRYWRKHHPEMLAN
jgi:glyoxylase-like metal-dependent hydrolase (beta-lactamase superfamily II)